jgi:cell division septum initiation protein DivIVA
VSEFKIGSVEGHNVAVGDRSTIKSHDTVRGTNESRKVPALLGDLAEQIEASSATVREMQQTLEELKTELAQKKVRNDRVQNLLTKLGAAAGTVTAVATSVENVRHALGLGR